MSDPISGITAVTSTSDRKRHLLMSLSCKLQTEEGNRQIQSLIDYPSVVPHGGKSTVPPHLERGSLWDYFGDERSVMQKRRSHITDRQSRIETSTSHIFESLSNETYCLCTFFLR